MLCKYSLRAAQMSTGEIIRKRSPLSYAAENNTTDVVRLLLKMVQTFSKETGSAERRYPTQPKNGTVDVVRLLLENGADVQRGDDSQKTPLSYAAENGTVDVVRLLLRMVQTFSEEMIPKNPIILRNRKKHHGCCATTP